MGVSVFFVLCSKEYRCSDRHFVTPALDSPQTYQGQMQLPAEGTVKVRFTFSKP
jgi:hypothetical protein